MIIILTWLILALGYFAFAYFTVVRSYLHVEQEGAKQDERIATGGLRSITAALDAYIGDWGAWDETLLFARGQLGSFIQDNLMDATFDNAGLNLLLFLDTAGTVVYGKAYDLLEHREAPFPADFSAYLQADKRLYSHTDETSKLTGILALPGSLLCLSSMPILNSNGEGPIGGTVIVGRFLDERTLAEIGERTELELSIHRIDQPSLPGEIQAALDSSATSEHPYLVHRGNDRMMIYSVVNDLYGLPAFVLGIDEPRTVHQRGLQTIVRLFIWFLVSTVAFTLINMLLLNRVVLTRLASLARWITRIRETGVTSERIEVRQHDEIGNLAGEINTMLASIETAHRALLAAKTDAERANRAKSEFLANMSHELRTPLNHIIGFAGLLAGQQVGPLNPTQREYANDVLSSGHHLLELISEILEFTKIEAGRHLPQFAEVSLLPLLEQSAAAFRGRAEQQRLTMTVDLTGCPRTAVADERMLQQILNHLLANAVKFTPEGGTVALQARACPAPGGTPGFCVSVRDSGIGIAAENLERIFEPFEMVERSSSRKYPGTGLGLSLSRHLVEMHQGKIWCESAGLGSGSTFQFVLPLAGKDSG